MRRVKQLIDMSTSERTILLRALIAVLSARMKLWLRVGFQPVRTQAAEDTTPLKAPPRMADWKASQYAWAVKAVSRYVPVTTCLTQALALHSLLAASGRKSRIEIGVSKDDGRFEAHAWVVCNDQILIGGPNIDRYVSLPVSMSSGEATCI
jgi:hypothetical protein